MSSILIDSFEFCRRNEKLKGKVAVADLPRLLDMCDKQSGDLAWRLEGSTGKRGHLQLDLAVSGKLNLVCQRCMEPFVLDLDSQVMILIARDEDAADEIEGMLADDDPTEVMVGEEKQDVLTLVEDEVLLTLTLSPDHNGCPGFSEKNYNENPKSPFSILRDLKK